MMLIIIILLHVSIVFTSHFIIKTQNMIPTIKMIKTNNIKNGKGNLLILLLQNNIFTQFTLVYKYKISERISWEIGNTRYESNSLYFYLGCSLDVSILINEFFLYVRKMCRNSILVADSMLDKIYQKTILTCIDISQLGLLE